MKDSHNTAPRQLADCSFTPSADPIERPEPQPMDTFDAFICWLAVAVIAVIMWLDLSGYQWNA